MKEWREETDLSEEKDFVVEQQNRSSPTSQKTEDNF